MAEINIERKKRPVWPWIFLLLLVALLFWGVYELTNEPDEVEVEEVPATGMIIPAGAQQHTLYPWIV